MSTTAEGRILWRILRTCREARGLSQPAAAEAVGLRQPNVSEHESGRVSIAEDTLVKYARGYGVTVEELLDEGLRHLREAETKSPRPRK